MFAFRHVRLLEAKDSMGEFGFEYDAAAVAYLQPVPAEEIALRCDALFIDEVGEGFLFSGCNLGELGRIEEADMDYLALVRKVGPSSLA